MFFSPLPKIAQRLVIRLYSTTSAASTFGDYSNEEQITGRTGADISCGGCSDGSMCMAVELMAERMVGGTN